MSSDTWRREKAEAGVQLIELADKRHVHTHRILVTQQVDVESGSFGRDPLRPTGGRIRLNAVYVAGPYRGQLNEVTTFGGELVGGWEQPWIRLTIGDVYVPERLRGLGLGTYLFNEVVAWAQSLGLKNAKVWPIKLIPGGSETNHARASRFYGQFGVRFLPAEDGKPPESDPELLVTDLHTAPLPEKSSAIVRATSEGFAEAIDETIAQHEERLMKKHGKEYSQVSVICDRWKWAAISGWLVLALFVTAWLR